MLKSLTKKVKQNTFLNKQQKQTEREREEGHLVFWRIMRILLAVWVVDLAVVQFSKLWVKETIGAIKIEVNTPI